MYAGRSDELPELSQRPASCPSGGQSPPLSAGEQVAVRRPRPTDSGLRGFSLVELVIVIVIIGIIAAIAVPRLGGTAQRAQAHALLATLRNVRSAIDLFQAEHGRYPGYDPADGSPDGKWFVDQLTLYSDAAGQTSETYGDPFIYGPYLRAPFPTNPFNGLATVQVLANPSGQIILGMSGWVAVLPTGDFGINAGDADLAEIGVTSGDPAKEMRGGLQVGG
jgi:prepilin-type N-terminal cleavage/methylation domain-containing protein